MGKIDPTHTSAVRSAASAAPRPTRASEIPALTQVGQEPPAAKDRLIRQAPAPTPSDADLARKVQEVQRRLEAQAAADEHRQIAEASGRAAKIGTGVGTGVASVLMIRSGLHRAPGVPLSMVGKAFSVLGAGFSGYNIGTDALKILDDLKASSIQVRPLLAHSLDLAGNAVTLGGTFALASGAGAGPGLLAVGVGTLMTTAADFLEPKQP